MRLMQHFKSILFACSFALAPFSFYSCEKIADEVPECLESTIEDFDDDWYLTVTRVEEFRFQDELVYHFVPQEIVVDAQSAVFNSDCELIGWLGGLAGNTEINGEDFNTAELIRVVWPE